MGNSSVHHRDAIIVIVRGIVADILNASSTNGMLNKITATLMTYHRRICQRSSVRDGGISNVWRGSGRRAAA